MLNSINAVQECDPKDVNSTIKAGNYITIQNIFNPLQAYLCSLKFF